MAKNSNNTPKKYSIDVRKKEQKHFIYLKYINKLCQKCNYGS